MSVIGIVKSVEECIITVSTVQTVVDYNLTKGQIISNCVPFASWRFTSSSTVEPHYFLFDVEMVSGPKVRVQRGSASGEFYVIVYVVEFEPSKVKVQQGIWSIGSAAASDTVSLSQSVTKNNAAIQFYYEYDNATLNSRAFLVGGYIKTGGSDIEFERWQTETTTCSGHYYVFEALGGEFSVGHYDTGDVTAQFVEVTVPAVTLSRTFLLTSYQTDYNSTDIERSTFYARMKDTVTVRVDRNQNSLDNSRHWIQVIESPDDTFFVQHRYAYRDASTANDVWTLPQAVDPDRAISQVPTVFPGARTDGSLWYHGVYRTYLSDAGTKYNMERYLPSPPDNSAYTVGQIIEFTGTEYFCEGVVTVESTAVSGTAVQLFNRNTTELVGDTLTTGSGTFAIPTRFHEDLHYLVVLSPVSGTNSAVLDWLDPQVP